MHLDGWVYAHTLFNSSANYRSAVVHGTLMPLAGDEAVEALTGSASACSPAARPRCRRTPRSRSRPPPRWRWTSPRASGRSRSATPGRGTPSDEVVDPELWTGVLPVASAYGAPQTAGGRPGCRYRRPCASTCAVPGPVGDPAAAAACSGRPGPGSAAGSRSPVTCPIRRAAAAALLSGSREYPQTSPGCRPPGRRRTRTAAAHASPRSASRAAAARVVQPAVEGEHDVQPGLDAQRAGAGDALPAGRHEPGLPGPVGAHRPAVVPGQGTGGDVAGQERGRHLADRVACLVQVAHIGARNRDGSTAHETRRPRDRIFELVPK